ncbi:RL15 [Enterospora canceri]|uniref:Ribosomal protein L15 n=1 Tax=Enterospora canceri TaxID=1081671 RepID=A0A1Y1S6H8_9MICR|nr:RL15 [Enterospora canceri]
MSFAQIMREIHRKKQSDVMKYMTRITLVEARQNDVVHRKEKPAFLERARKLGYKAKNGYTIWSVRIRKGDAIRNYNNGNTRGKCVNAGIHQIKPGQNKQAEAEQIVGHKLGGLRLLNSYEVGQDLRYHHFEVIMVDPSHNSIRNDHKINWICNAVHKHREMRGLTSAGQKSRGLGHGYKFNNTKGGSRRAAWRNRNTLSLKRYR